jgi:hypothetical protein
MSLLLGPDRWVLLKLNQDILFSFDAFVAKSLELQFDPEEPDIVSDILGRACWFRTAVQDAPRTNAGIYLSRSTTLVSPSKH